MSETAADRRTKTLLTRASSINRALDQIGDKWCLLIIQEVFWGINSFSAIMHTTGASRGVLSDRLRWLVSIDCLRQVPKHKGSKRLRYRLTRKSLDMYDSALMALAWERHFFSTPELDAVALTHRNCGNTFSPRMQCRHCADEIHPGEVSYHAGPGAATDERNKKVRRRSSIPTREVPSRRSVYRNLINIVGDRWTANIIALAFHGINRFDDFHRELPVATNILADRLRFLVAQGIFLQTRYLARPPRYEYCLSEKGEATFAWFLTLQQWGDKWCDQSGQGAPLQLRHNSCGEQLYGQVTCSACGAALRAREVDFQL